MKMIVEESGERFEIEAEAAYIAAIGPKNSDGDSMLLVIGRTNTLGIIKAVSNTLSSFFQTYSKGNEYEQKKLWKRFKNEYREAKYTSTFDAKREEMKPVTEETMD